MYRILFHADDVLLCCCWFVQSWNQAYLSWTIHLFTRLCSVSFKFSTVTHIYLLLCALIDQYFTTSVHKSLYITHMLLIHLIISTRPHLWLWSVWLALVYLRKLLNKLWLSNWCIVCSQLIYHLSLILFFVNLTSNHYSSWFVCVSCFQSNSANCTNSEIE